MALIIVWREKKLALDTEIFKQGKGICSLWNHKSTKTLAVSAKKFYWKQPSPVLVDNCTCDTIPFPV
jgi:hypothetical protein